VCPFWRRVSKALGTGVPECGALEFLSLEEDMEVQLHQQRTVTFTAQRRSTVNSLSCFIWVGFNPPGAAEEGSARGAGEGREGKMGSSKGEDTAAVAAGAGAGGASAPADPSASSSSPMRTMRSSGPMDLGPGGGTSYPYGVPGLPTLKARAKALSSAQSDSPEMVANNWPNIVVWLHRPLTLEAGQQLQVQSTADLEADPHVYSACGGWAKCWKCALSLALTLTHPPMHPPCKCTPPLDRLEVQSPWHCPLCKEEEAAGGGGARRCCASGGAADRARHSLE
jgi:hypothetical protein